MSSLIAVADAFNVHSRVVQALERCPDDEILLEMELLTYGRLKLAETEYHQAQKAK